MDVIGELSRTQYQNSGDPEILSKIARTAYRRPVNETDMKVLRDFYAQGRQAKGTFFRRGASLPMGIRLLRRSRVRTRFFFASFTASEPMP